MTPAGLQLVTIGQLHELEPVDLTRALGELELLRVQILARLNPTPGPVAAAPVERTSEYRLKAAEVRDRLNVSRSWLYRNCSRLPFAARVGTGWRFSERGLARYLQEGKSR